MIFIICAMKCEASSIISLLKLKPDVEINGFYRGDDCSLVVTGIGSKCIENAFASFPMPIDANKDIFVNIGVCGCIDEKYPKGSIFLIDEVHDEVGSTPYYPDLLVKADIPSAGCTTYSKVKTDTDCPTLLAEMEAYTFYTESLKHVRSDRIHVLKIVSDYMVLSGLTKNDISGYVHKNRSIIDKYIAKLKDYPDEALSPDYSRYYDFYKFTASVRTELDRFNMYFYYKEGKFPDSDIYEGFKKPANKRESMRIYDEIKKLLI